MLLSSFVTGAIVIHSATVQNDEFCKFFHKFKFVVNLKNYYIMSGVNKVILIGRLGKDPEVRHLESGASVANFSLATSEVYKDRTTGERKEITEWHNVVLWRGLANVAEKYLHKGEMVYIEGKLRTRSWEKDGITRYTTEVFGDNMTMLSPRSTGEGGNANATAGMASHSQNTAGSTVQNQPVATTSAATANIEAESETDDLPF